MFSSVGPVSAPSARSGRGITSKGYFMQPKGFSVRVFKGPTLSSHPYTATAKFDNGYRPISNSDSRHRSNWRSSRYKEDNKSYLDRRDLPPSEPNLSQRRQNNFGIYPSATLDTFIYERSISSKSENCAESILDSPSESAFSASTFVSPTLSSDSTETLQSTLETDGMTHLSPSHHTSLSTQPSFPEQLPLTAHNQSSQTRAPKTNLDHIAPLRAFDSFASEAFLRNSSLVPSSNLGTTSSDGYGTERAGATISRSSTPFSQSQFSTSMEGKENYPRAPLGFVQRQQSSSPTNSRRDGYTGDAPTPSLQPASFGAGYEPMLSSASAKTDYVTDVWRDADRRMDTEPVASYSDSDISAFEKNNATTGTSRGREAARPLPVPPCGPRDVDSEQWPKKVNNRPPGLQTALGSQGFSNAQENSTHTPSQQAQGWSNSVSKRLSISIPKRSSPPISDRGHGLAVATTRCVRWDENLICPSPILPSQRRKGWFNRKGDQLWTNDGAYRPPQSGYEFPSDLDDYPEYGQGWMNELGVRIDMEHRLIPKTPLRSALKKPRVLEQDFAQAARTEHATVGS